MPRSRSAEVETQEVPPLTRAEQEALEDGEEKASRYQAEAEARPEDHPLRVAEEEYAAAEAAREGEAEAPEPEPEPEPEP